MRNLSIDIETYSPEQLVKCGVYRYCQHPDFEILLFGYSIDGAPSKWWTSPPESVCRKRSTRLCPP